MFYDWRESVMSALSTTNIPIATVLTLGNKVVFHCMTFGFLVYLFMNDFLPGYLMFAVVKI